MSCRKSKPPKNLPTRLGPLTDNFGSKRVTCCNPKFTNSLISHHSKIERSNGKAASLILSKAWHDVTMYTKLFPPLTDWKSRFTNVLVVWELENYIIPEGLDIRSTLEKIKAVIAKEEGLRSRNVNIWIFGSADNSWLNALKEEYSTTKDRFHVYRGDQRARFNRIIANIAFWSFNVKSPINLLILSENMAQTEQDPKFCRFRLSLQKRGFSVASAHPSTLLNQQTEPLVAPPSRFPEFICTTCTSKDDKA
ncbi:hypothetical protein CARUB_v10006896mg [Capsella rubella]|uniref:NYN domain-containing protein n=1 Tax=Capsella rubella TaxID=81985 RepID=R0H181_9BRAS|nr:uncharacterized protein LOC17877834 isoform X1 [Capsella rubella]EOA18375.1 hypothetical protein CARUB_v10006896mg [Capsella rubella]